MPARIVTTTYRYKRPPRKRKAVPLEGPAIVAPRAKAAPAIVQRDAKPSNDDRMVNESHTPWRDRALRDILKRMRHNGCGLLGVAVLVAGFLLAAGTAQAQTHITSAVRALPETIDEVAPLPVPPVCPVPLAELLAEPTS